MAGSSGFCFGRLCKRGRAPRCAGAATLPEQMVRWLGPCWDAGKRGREETGKEGSTIAQCPPLWAAWTCLIAGPFSKPLLLTASMGQGVIISVAQLKGLKPDEGSDSLKVSLLVASKWQSHGLDLTSVSPNATSFQHSTLCPRVILKF